MEFAYIWSAKLSAVVCFRAMTRAAEFFVIVLITVIGVPSLLFGAEKDTPVPRYEWDLGSDHNYAVRTEQQVRTLGALELPGLFFLDSDTVAVVYQDNRGAQSWDSLAIVKARAEDLWNFKLHALIFKVSEGPKSAKELQWKGITRWPQFLPLGDGGFVLRIDDRVMVYSAGLELVKEMKLELHDSFQLPNGETIHEEFNTIAVSTSGKSIVTCHTTMLKGHAEENSTNVRWFSTQTLDQIGKTSTSKFAAGAGCGFYFTATDTFAIMGKFRIAPDGLPWKELNIGINDCSTRGPYRVCDRYELLDDSHLLSSARTVVDFNGNVSYVIPKSPVPGAGAIKPDVRLPQPRASDVTRLAYDEGGIQKIRGGGHEDWIHVADWKSGKELLSIRIVQQKLPVLHGNGLSEELAGMLDENYALSPDGKKLAVLNLDKLTIYDVP
jgi:hypothetical protein